MRRVSPKLQSWLNNLNNITIPTLLENGFKPTPINAREGLANLTKAFITDVQNVARITDDIVKNDEYDVPIRIYNPVPEHPLPILIFCHGGGHMSGSVTVYDPICRKLANATQHIVVSIEYRLAPECRYPAGINDAYAVTKNIYDTLDNAGIQYISTLSLIGDSGGGAMVATVAAKAQFDDLVSINKQILIYPSLDYTMSCPSIEQNAEGYLLQKDKIAWYFDHYFHKVDNRKKASPLHCNFTCNLPNTLVFTAEFCPLRDEGMQYVQKVLDNGGYAEHIHFSDMIHTFLNMENLVPEECNSVYRSITTFLHQSDYQKTTAN
ncbi:alpha/beta hydrolase [Marinomonas flavescens]|uniref:alpha/beta hydrolase n=1 Tax=Marinomonas flavescens TaxID=2529379 RepID=UPI001056DE47|nr:alpha/beta hydrolase [Marinomonas flavescens]